MGRSCSAARLDEDSSNEAMVAAVGAMAVVIWVRYRGEARGDRRGAPISSLTAAQSHVFVSLIRAASDQSPVDLEHIAVI